jgi:hypothetical protein
MSAYGCPSCGKTVMFSDVACRHCGRPLTPRPEPSSKRSSRWLPRLFIAFIAAVVLGTGAIAVMVVLAILFSPSTPRQSVQTATPPASAPIRVETEDEREARRKAARDAFVASLVPVHSIMAAYEVNEIAAEQQYKGQTLNISGTVREVDTDILGVPYVLLTAGGEYEVWGVQAMFPRDRKESLVSLSKGDQITVRCRIDGKMLNVIAKDCEFP